MKINFPQRGPQHAKIALTMAALPQERSAVPSAAAETPHPSPTADREGGEDLPAQPTITVKVHGEPTVIAKELVFRPNGQFAPGHPRLDGCGRPPTRPLKKAIMDYLEDNPQVLPALVISALRNAHDDSSYFNSIRDIIDGKPAQEIAANVSLFDGLAERLAAAKEKFEEAGK
jgi:hypothetical protein